MHLEEKLKSAQDALREEKLDGWLLYDYRRANDLACFFLEIPRHKTVTRRFFYWIPQRGEAVKIVHAIENPLGHLPGETLTYRTWQEMEKHLFAVLGKGKKIAMEYSPRNALPSVSKADAGTVELVRESGAIIASSANLLQKYTSVWDKEQWQTHLLAADVLSQTADKAWDFIASHLRSDRPVTERDVQQLILKEFSLRQCLSADLPICAVNAHTADPHYAPEEKNASLIKKGDFILIDLWCKRNVPHAVYADITRVAVAAPQPTERQQEIFSIVRRAQKTATEFVKKKIARQEKLRGWEVDDVCRRVIKEAGYGEYFIHRTGHNIGSDDHGSGAHLDNFETKDDRELLPGTCFSIEPGIYLPGEFGVRLEYDVFIDWERKVHITGGAQEEIVCLQ